MTLSEDLSTTDLCECFLHIALSGEERDSEDLPTTLNGCLFNLY